MDSAEGQEELHTFAQRVRARFEAELAKQPKPSEQGVCSQLRQWRPVVVMLHRHMASPCRHGPRSTVHFLASAGDTDATDVDGVEDKVLFVLEHSIRPDRCAAEAFVACNRLSRFTIADYQQRAEALRMFGHPLAGAPVKIWHRTLTGFIVPRLAFIAEHACVPRSQHRTLVVPRLVVT
jgi:hypothetical protein